MSKIVIENKRGKIKIINKLSYPETVNERVYNDIVSGNYEGFLPLSVIQKRKETRVECVIQDMLPLAQYLGGIVTRKMFLDFVYEIVLLIKNCEKHMINANNLELQSDKIFVDPRTKGIKCIFWPVVNNQRGVSPHFFLKQLPFELNFYQNESVDYLEAYNAFFDSLAPFSINNFEKLILNLAGKETVSGNRIAPSESLSGQLGRENKTAVTNNRSKTSIEYDPFADVMDYGVVQEVKEVREARAEKRPEVNAVFCTACGAKNPKNSRYCSQCGSPIVSSGMSDIYQEPPVRGEQPKVPINNEPSGEAGQTTVLSKGTIGETIDLSSWNQEVRPFLIRKKTGEKIMLDKPIFRIGKEKSYVDYFIGDNTAVSRSHANIINRNGEYFVVDLNSLNHTYLNGNLIRSEEEVRIAQGAKIRLANEEFEFYLY